MARADREVDDKKIAEKKRKPTVLVCHRPCDVVDSRIRHPTALQHIQPLLRSLLLRYRRNQLLKQISILHSVGISNKLRISLPLLLSQSITQNTEQAIITSS